MKIAKAFVYSRRGHPQQIAVAPTGIAWDRVEVFLHDDGSITRTLVRTSGSYPSPDEMGTRQDQWEESTTCHFANPEDAKSVKWVDCRPVMVNAFSLSMLPRDSRDEVYSILALPMTTEEVKKFLKVEGVRSAIGHAYFASLVSKLLGLEIPVNRESIRLAEARSYEAEYEGVPTVAIVAQYVGPRLPEGTTVLPEEARIEFWRVTIRQAVVRRR